MTIKVNRVDEVATPHGMCGKCRNVIQAGDGVAWWSFEFLTDPPVHVRCSSPECYPSDDELRMTEAEARFEQAEQEFDNGAFKVEMSLGDGKMSAAISAAESTARTVEAVAKLAARAHPSGGLDSWRDAVVEAAQAPVAGEDGVREFMTGLAEAVVED